MRSKVKSNLYIWEIEWWIRIPYERSKSASGHNKDYFLARRPKTNGLEDISKLIKTYTLRTESGFRASLGIDSNSKIFQKNNDIIICGKYKVGSEISILEELIVYYTYKLKEC